MTRSFIYDNWCDPISELYSLTSLVYCCFVTFAIDYRLSVISLHFQGGNGKASRLSCCNHYPPPWSPSPAVSRIQGI